MLNLSVQHLGLYSQEDAFEQGSVPKAPLLQAITDSIFPLEEHAPPSAEDLVRVMTTLRLSWQPVGLIHKLSPNVVFNQATLVCLLLQET